MLQDDAAVPAVGRSHEPAYGPPASAALDAKCRQPGPAACPASDRSAGSSFSDNTVAGAFSGHLVGCAASPQHASAADDNGYLAGKRKQIGEIFGLWIIVGCQLRDHLSETFALPTRGLRLIARCFTGWARLNNRRKTLALRRSP